MKFHQYGCLSILNNNDTHRYHTIGEEKLTKSSTLEKNNRLLRNAEIGEIALPREDHTNSLYYPVSVSPKNVYIEVTLYGLGRLYLCI